VCYKEVLDGIGHVMSEIVVSSPDENDRNEKVDRESKDLVRAFASA
jgi:type I restriction enzyme R subunit